MAKMTADVVVYKRPLAEPEPAWCDRHADHCALAQQVALTVRVNGEPDEQPLGVVRLEGHR